MVHRLWIAACFVTLALAQNPNELFTKAPPDIDEALRARVSEFYQLQVDGKFRQADALVAEDSKDSFYAANKTQYLGFRIANISYTDHFTKATAIVLCKMVMPFPGFAGKPLEMPVPSYWKVENGKWYWHVEQGALPQLPFATPKNADLKPANGRPAPQEAAAQGSPPHIPESKAEIAGLLRGVAADKEAVTLPGVVTITNGMPGVVQLELADRPPAGVDAAFDRAQLNAGEKAQLTFSIHSGAKPKPGSVSVRVLPINRVIRIQVLVQ